MIYYKQNFTILHLIYQEIFAKRSILFKFKEEEDFNRRNTLGILRIKI